MDEDTYQVLDWDAAVGTGHILVQWGRRSPELLALVTREVISPMPEAGVDLTGTWLYQVGINWRMGRDVPPEIFSALTEEGLRAYEREQAGATEAEAREEQARRDEEWLPRIEKAKGNPRLWLYGQVVGNQIAALNGARFDLPQGFEATEDTELAFRIKETSAGVWTAVDTKPLEDQYKSGKGSHASFCQVCGAVTTWMNEVERKETFVRTGESEDGFRSEGYFQNNDIPAYCIDCRRREEKEAKEALLHAAEADLAEAQRWVDVEISTTDFLGKPLILVILEAKIYSWREEYKAQVRVSDEIRDTIFHVSWVNWSEMKSYVERRRK